MHARAQRFPLFDSLRAIAALSVLFGHAGDYAGLVGSDNPLRPFFARLDVGVVIFFLISGFLLYRPFVAARIGSEARPATGAYAWRRFLRIVPGYWVALTVLALTVGVGGLAMTLESIGVYYGLAQIYYPFYLAGGISQAWSLCVEISFYAFLPLYALAMRVLPGASASRRYAGEAAGLVVLFAIALAYKVILISGSTDLGGHRLLYLPAYLDQFALGMGLAVLSVAMAERDRLPTPLRLIDRFPGLAWGAALLAFYVVSTQIGLHGDEFLEGNGRQTLERHYLFAIVAVGLLLPAIFGDQSRGVVRRILANQLLLYIGLVSYGVYLYHVGVFRQLREWGMPTGSIAGLPAVVVWASLGVVMAVALASASYWAVERPLLKLKRLVPAGGPMPGEPGPTEPGPMTIDEPLPARPEGRA